MGRLHSAWSRGKEVCRGMVAQDASDLRTVKRVASYIQMFERVVDTTGAESEPRVDSGWVGCRRSRKSTSGGVSTVGGMAIEMWSSTQSAVAKSSGGAEYYASAHGAVEA